MFLAEALPTIVFGACALWYFPDRPAQARWLTAADREWLETHGAGRAGNSQQGGSRVQDWSALRQTRMWACAALWFCLLSGSYGVIFWLPQLVKAITDLDPLEIGVIGALPWTGALLAMYVNAKHSDRTGERFWHIALPAAISGGAFLAAWLTSLGIVALLALVVGGVGLGAAQGAFWALPTRLLSRSTLPMAVVTINVIGSAGGLVMPRLMGWAREAGGGFGLPTGLLVAILLGGALLVVLLRVSQGAITRTAMVP